MKSFKEYVSETRKGVVITFGNYSTINEDHYNIIAKVRKIAEKMGFDSMLFVSDKNFDEKIHTLKEELDIDIHDSPVSNIYNIVRVLSEENYRKIVVVTDPERVDEIGQKIGKYINHPEDSLNYSINEFWVVPDNIVLEYGQPDYGSANMYYKTSDYGPNNLILNSAFDEEFDEESTIEESIADFDHKIYAAIAHYIGVSDNSAKKMEKNFDTKDQITFIKVLNSSMSEKKKKDWIINLFKRHNISEALEIGTDEIVRSYSEMTPGENLKERTILMTRLTRAWDRLTKEKKYEVALSKYMDLIKKHGQKHGEAFSKIVQTYDIDRRNFNEFLMKKGVISTPPTAKIRA
jgi:hypothetical protein